MEPLTEEAKQRIQYTLEAAFENPDAVTALRSSLELHMFAANWNWDNATKEPLFCVIRDPRCDKGTALRLYWAADPVYFYETYARGTEVEDYYLEHYSLIKELEERFVNEFYTQRNIGFDPHNDWIPGQTSSDNLKQFVPPIMLEPTPGVQPEGENDFYN